MFSRVDSGTALGSGLLGAGTVAEIAKKGQEAPVDLMHVDVLFGLVPGYYLHAGGLIAIVGLVILMHSSWRGHKEKKRRERKEL